MTSMRITNQSLLTYDLAAELVREEKERVCVVNQQGETKEQSTANIAKHHGKCRSCCCIVVVVRVRLDPLFSVLCFV